MADDKKKKNIDMFGVAKNAAKAVAAGGAVASEAAEEKTGSILSELGTGKPMRDRARQIKTMFGVDAAKKGTEAVAAEAVAKGAEAQAKELATESVGEAEAGRYIEDKFLKKKEEE